MTIFADATSSAGFSGACDFANSAWLDYLIQHPAHHYTARFICQAYFELAGGQGPSGGAGTGAGASAAVTLARALPPLHQNPVDSDTLPTAGSAILTILSLAMAANVLGDLESARQHLDGLARVVALQGGIAGLGSVDLQIKCCR